MKVKFTPPDDKSNLSKWELLEDWQSKAGRNVPKGFVSDGGSIPSVFRGIINPTGIGFPAYIVHDFVLSKGYAWPEALLAFREELGLLGIPNWKQTAIKTAVWVHGFSKSPKPVAQSNKETD